MTRDSFKSHTGSALFIARVFGIQPFNFSHFWNFMSHCAIFHIFNVKASLLKSELILDFKDSIELINVKKLSLVVCYFDSIKSDLEFLN